MGAGRSHGIAPSYDGVLEVMLIVLPLRQDLREEHTVDGRAAEAVLEEGRQPPRGSWDRWSAFRFQLFIPDCPLNVYLIDAPLEAVRATRPLSLRNEQFELHNDSRAP